MSGPVPPSTAADALDRARSALARREYDAAARDAGRAFALAPTASAAALRAVALVAGGRASASLQALDTALALAPRASWPHRLRALALLELRRGGEAVAVAEEAVRIAPQDPWAHHALARACAAERRGGDARAAAMRAIALAPLDPDLRAALGELYGGGHPAVAEGHLRAALALDATRAAIWDALAQLLQGQGRSADAAEAWQRASRIDPAFTARRGGTGKLLPLLWVGAAVFLFVVLLGLVPDLVRRIAPAAAPHAAVIVNLAALIVPVAFVVVAGVLIARSRALPLPPAASLLAALRDAAAEEHAA